MIFFEEKHFQNLKRRKILRLFNNFNALWLNNLDALPFNNNFNALFINQNQRY